MSVLDDVAARLECLRLAHSSDADSAAVVERAHAYADFVLGGGTEGIRAASEPTGPVRSEG